MFSNLMISYSGGGGCGRQNPARLIIVLVSVVIASLSVHCRTEHVLSGSFIVMHVDSVTFNQNVIGLRSPEGQTFVVITPRSEPDDSLSTPYTCERLQVGNEYQLSLREYETPPELVVALRGMASNIEAYYIHSELFDTLSSNTGLLMWSRGGVKSPVYLSDDIVGTGVCKKYPTISPD